MGAKLRSIKGETIVESLVSMLIISLVFVFLTNAIIATARVNDSVKNSDVSYDMGQRDSVGSIAVTIDDTLVTVDAYAVDSKSGDTRYYYYDPEYTEVP